MLAYWWVGAIVLIGGVWAVVKFKDKLPLIGKKTNADGTESTGLQLKMLSTENLFHNLVEILNKLEGKIVLSTAIRGAVMILLTILQKLSTQLPKEDSDKATAALTALGQIFMVAPVAEEADLRPVFVDRDGKIVEPKPDSPSLPPAPLTT